MNAKVINGDCVEVMAGLQANSIDAVVCDPPYGLRFMGKAWDDAGDGPAQQEWHRVWGVQALRVLKPGGHLVAFGGSRAYHRLASALEDAGFEIRDCLMWLYGSGFPKSLDVSKALDKSAGAVRPVVETRVLTGNAAQTTKEKGGTYASNTDARGVAAKTVPVTAPATQEAKQWAGWGTALKPAHEPAVLARKPLEGTVAANVQKWGTGALNIDGCRIAISADDNIHAKNPHTVGTIGVNGIYGRGTPTGYSVPAGRWPANVMLDEEAGAMLDEQSGVSKSTGGQSSLGAFRDGTIYGSGVDKRESGDPGYGDFGGASRFFYCAKASRRERDEGLDEMPMRARPTMGSRNTHPTVKPIEVMRWLIRLVCPPGGLVLDPFLGSGSTGIAAMREGCRFVGIEREPEYFAIAQARIKSAGASR